MCLGYVQGDISHSDSLGDVGGASYHIKGKRAKPMMVTGEVDVWSVFEGQRAQ